MDRQLLINTTDEKDSRTLYKTIPIFTQPHTDDLDYINTDSDFDDTSDSDEPITIDTIDTIELENQKFEDDIESLAFCFLL